MTSRTPLHSSGFTLIVRWAIVLALWVLLISMATGQTGISNYMELVKNRDELAAVNQELMLQNQMLDEQIHRLRTSKDAQVRFLKENFGYVEKGEFIYHFNSKPIPDIKAKKPKEQSAAGESGRGKRL